MDKDLGEEESKDIKKQICGVDFNDIELLRSVDREEIDRIRKITKIKLLNEEIKKLEKEISKAKDN